MEDVYLKRGVCNQVDFRVMSVGSSNYQVHEAKLHH